MRVGLDTATSEALCVHHGVSYSDNWAEANRVICDLLHRGKAPARLAERDRSDEWWASVSDTA